MKHIYLNSLLLLLTGLLFRCAPPLAPADPPPPMFPPGDPFTAIAPLSQWLDFDPTEDNVLIGSGGTKIVIPEGAIVDGNGNPVREPCRFELVEARKPSDFLLYNLTAQSDGNPLETDGMLYFSVQTADSVPVAIDPEKPIYFEVPTQIRKGGMEVYTGERLHDGSINWVDPAPMETWLTPVDIDLLNFYPPNFEATVEAAMPFRKHEIADKALKDSLYFTLVPGSHESLTRGFSQTDIREPMQQSHEGEEHHSHGHGDPEFDNNCGVDPLKVKAIWQEEFEGTVIATREFENRLMHLFSIPNSSAIDVYINGLDRNLYELDEEVLTLIDSGDPLYRTFQEFAAQKLTNVEGGGEYAEILREFYEAELRSSQKELAKLQKQQAEKLTKANEDFQKTATQYREVLEKRESRRMQSYGFTRSITGWINIDRGTEPKDWNYREFDVIVDNYSEFDRVYTYLYLIDRKSLLKLTEEGTGKFSKPADIPLPKDEWFETYAIGFKGKEMWFALMNGKFFAEDDNLARNLSLSLPESGPQSLEDMIWGDFITNQRAIAELQTDLAYQEKLWLEKERQAQLQKESRFIRDLEACAFPNCEPIYNGKLLFQLNCASCHKVNGPMTGPGLAGLSKSRSCDWLYRWVQNPGAFVQENEEANALYKTYNKTQMTAFPHFSKAQIQAIFDYVDRENGDTLVDWDKKCPPDEP